MANLFDHLTSVQELLRRSPFGLMTDVDGTIAPIAPTPEGARVSPLCRKHLASLCRRLKLVAAISGRRAEEVREMVGVEGMVYIGNHGLEEWAHGSLEFREGVREYSEKIAATLAEVSALLDIEGIILENKGVTACIHYRLSPDEEGARKAVISAIANSPSARELRIIQGKKVVNLCPPVEVNKGSALSGLVEKYGLRGGIYLGDDITDLDAFLALRAISEGPAFKGIALAVVSAETPQEVKEGADFLLHGVGEVERFFAWLNEIIPG